MQDTDIRFAPRPEPPYYAALFTSRHVGASEGFVRLASEVFRLATRQPGFIGVEYSRDAEQFGLTVFYWRDRDSLDAWREAVALEVERIAEAVAGMDFSDHYVLRIMRVEHQEKSSV